MISCITLKNGTFKQFKIKNVDTNNIYKKCGYKSSTNFNMLYSWKIDDNTQLELWSKLDVVNKSFNQHAIFSKYAINVNSNNRCIFLVKSKTDYINLDSKFFNTFFDLKEEIETGSITDINDDNSQESSIENKTKTIKTHIENNNDKTTKITSSNSNSNKNEDYEVSSELSYELYSYSDEEV